MGIFGNKQQDTNEPLDIPAAAASAPVSTGSIDGVIPTYQDTPSSSPLHDPTSISAPPVDDRLGGPISDYIMTDAPTTPANTWNEPAHQHDLDDPESPEASSVDAEVSKPEPLSPDPFEAARSVPSTHPLPSPVDDTEDNDDPEDDLEAIKEKAIRELSPLVSHLDQSPEEKFHTAMMMLQATDDRSLIKAAYEAAQEITDDRTKAQALLDIVNEINYFTQRKSN